MAKVGIFWLYQRQIFGKAICIDQGGEAVSGLIDTDDNHVDVWEQLRITGQLPTELTSFEYQDVPRGRAIFSQKQHKLIVYLDKVLMNKESKQTIATFFDVLPHDVIWRRDSHYSTTPDDIDRLFLDF
jgi:hypothetical protein